MHAEEQMDSGAYIIIQFVGFVSLPTARTQGPLLKEVRNRRLVTGPLGTYRYRGCFTILDFVSYI